jgi:serine/threonine protein phosphatase PrpC
MPSLHAIAEQLVQRIESLVSADRQALTESLAARLRRLCEPDLSDELRPHFGDPFGPGEPLAGWCRGQIRSGHFDDGAFGPLLHAAAWLDQLARRPEPPLAFVPDWFRVDPRGLVVVFPPLLDLVARERLRARIADGQVRPHWLALDLPEAAQLEHCDAWATLLGSFARFLLEVFLSVAGENKVEILTALQRCRRRQFTLPPDLLELFREVLERPLTERPALSCRDLASAVLERFRSSPFVYRSVLNVSCGQEVFAYSVMGLNKTEPVNEDRVCCYQRGPVSFGFVADGVSTVDLGTGEMAAEEIVRLFRQEFQPRFDDLADELRQHSLLDPAADWVGPASEFLNDFVRRVNERVVAVANQLWNPESGKKPEAPMCATLTAALVLFDQALVASVGDSPALLYRPGPERLLKLTVEDHADLDDSLPPELDVDPKALTRVVGMGRLDPEFGMFMALPLQPPLLRVQLNEGDLLLLASDGLVECIDEPGGPERLRRLAETLRRGHSGPLRPLVRELIALGEDGLSDDNISATVFRVVGGGSEWVV